MSVTSLSQLASGQAFGIKKSSSKVQASMAKLASGKRITQAMQDIASLSIATGLQSQLSGLRSASTNVAQASSLLQVADGGLSQISNIVDRLHALSTQANSGALSDSARRGLNTEFQGLVNEIDRLSGNTNFNNVNLLDGSLSSGSQVQTSTDVGTQASGSLTFGGGINAGESIVLNGVTLTEGVDFNAGGTTQQTVENLASALNSSTDSRLSGFTFDDTGGTLEITADAAGEAGNQFTIDQASSTATFSVSGDALSGAGVFSLSGGAEGGISAGSVQANGQVNDSLVSSQAGTAASTTLNFNSLSDIQAGDTISIDDGEGGSVNFTFVTGTPTTNTEIQIGSNLETTLQNAVDTFENFSGPGDYGVRQLDFEVSGNSLTIRNEVDGNANDASGNPLDIALGTTGGSISSTQLNNGSSAGVDTTGVTNEAFIGNIQGFEATFNGNDSITARITVGDETYTAQITDTTPGANSTVRFTSENGGFFDVTLAGGNGQAVTNQAGADTFADRLDAAFTGLNFTQDREISSFNDSGRLIGTSASLQGSDFSNLNVDAVRVNAGIGGNARLEVEINGETYRTGAGFGTGIGANETVTLTSASNPSKTLTYRNGDTAINLRTNSDARTFQGELERAFGVGGSGNGATFQIGNTSSDSVSFSLGNFSSSALFGGQSLDLLSQGNAADALGVLGAAMNAVTSGRADVGSLQQAFGFAASNLESAIQNQDAARATLEDTDFASEATENALAQLQRQTGVALAAQTNRLIPNILNLLN